MKKILLAIVLGSAMVAAVPALAMARTEHHRGHHGDRHGDARVRHEHFGIRHDEASAPGTAPDAGTIASFTNGVLTIKLTDGSLVSGHVTSATEIRCAAAEPAEMEHSEHADGDHGGGNDNGNRGGNDNGDHNDRGEPGDGAQGEHMCSTASLAPTASVSDAELTVSGAGAVWNEVDLAG